MRFPGIMEAAKRLGVHRNHLYLVLRGDRVSHRLTRAYRAMKEVQ